MNKVVLLSFLTFLSIAVISDVCVYITWGKDNHVLDTNWWLLYANSIMSTLVSLFMGLYMISEILCCKPVRSIIDCVTSLTCVGPLIKFVYYMSMVGYFVVCGYLIYRTAPNSDTIKQLKIDHKYLYVTYVAQLIGGGLMVVLIGLYFALSPCRWSGCCSRDKNVKRHRQSHDSYDSLDGTL